MTRVAVVVVATMVVGTAHGAGSAVVAPTATPELAPGNWPMGRFDNRNTANNRLETELSADTIGDVELLWTAPLPGAHGSANPPLVADGVVYTTGGSLGLTAWDLDCRSDGGTCSPLWHSDISTWATPTIRSGIVYVNEVDRVAAYKLEECAAAGGDCSPEWVVEAQGDRFTSSPVPGRDSLFVNRETPLLGAGLDRGRGRSFFAISRDGCGGPVCAPLWTGQLGSVWDAGNAVSGDTVFTFENAGPAMAAFPASGCAAAVCEPLWKADGLGTATVYRGTVFAPGLSGFAAYDAQGCGAATCEPLWQGDAGNVVGELAAADGLVFAINTDARLMAFAASGCGAALCDPVWSGPATAGAALSGPVVANGLAYVHDYDNDVVSVFAFGCGAPACEPLAEIAVESDWSPTVADGKLVVVAGRFGGQPSLSVYGLAPG